MIIWELDKPVTRMEIEKHLEGDKKLSPTTILSFLARLEEKGFVAVEKEGKNNVYIAMVDREIYVQKESWNILKRLYNNSIKSFLTALFDSRELSDRELLELEEFVREKRLEQRR